MLNPKLYYTAEEILAEIRSHEGVTVDASPLPRFQDLLFLKPYSEIFPEPSHNTVRDLQERFTYFVNESGAMVYPCSPPPMGDFRFFVYATSLSPEALRDTPGETMQLVVATDIDKIVWKHMTRYRFVMAIDAFERAVCYMQQHATEPTTVH